MVNFMIQVNQKVNHWFTIKQAGELKEFRTKNILISNKCEFILDLKKTVIEICDSIKCTESCLRAHFSVKQMSNDSRMGHLQN